jgi:hypothetical protein
MARVNINQQYSLEKIEPSVSSGEIWSTPAR